MSAFNVNKNAGMTLIELLVVMLIVSLAVGLVTSLSVQQLDRYQQRVESRTLERYLRDIETNQKWLNRPVVINVEAHRLSLTDSQGLLSTKAFETLQFEPLTVTLSDVGYASVCELSTSFEDQPQVVYRFIKCPKE